MLDKSKFIENVLIPDSTLTELHDEINQLRKAAEKWEKEARLQYRLFNEELDISRQLREENERLKEIDERECTIAISLKRERDELKNGAVFWRDYAEALEKKLESAEKERNKLVKALEAIAYKNMGGGEAGYASIILSEIKGQGDENNG